MRQRDKEVLRKLNRLRTRVRKFSLNEFLYLLASFNWPGNNAYQYMSPTNEMKRRKGLMYWIYLPALAKFAILNSNDHVGESNRATEKALSEVDEMVAIINEIKDWVPSSLLKNPQFALEAFEFQLKNQHFPFQEKPNNILGRSLALFRDIPNEMNYELDLSQAFREIFGMPLQRFWALTLRIMFSYSGEWRPMTKFKGLDEPPLCVKHEEITKYLNKLSLTYEEFKEKAGDPEISFKGSSNQFYGYSPFDSHPIVTRNNEFLIISPHYFVKRMYLPTYFDLLKHFQIGKDPKNNPFSTSFGKVFQEYAGKQLEYLDDGARLIAEFKFGPRKKDFTDWSLKYADDLILIEVKKNLLPLNAKFVLDIELLKTKLKDSIIHGLEQCSKIANHVKERTTGLEDFAEVNNVHPVIVTFDDTYLLNSTFIRNLIDAQLSEAGIKFEHHWQVLTVRELEQIIALCGPNLTFLDLLKKKCESSEYLTMEWEGYLQRVGQAPQKNVMLMEIMEKEFEDINERNVAS